MKTCALTLVLLAAHVAIGQQPPPMTSTKNGTWNDPVGISNFPDCTTGGENCWTDMRTTAAKIFSDNSVTFKIDASCNVDSYNDIPSNTWTAHHEYGCVQVIHSIGGTIYALVHSHGSSGYALSKWTGSAWTDLSCCFVDFSGALDGSGLFVAHDPSGTMWVSINSGATFSHQAWCDPYPVSSEAAIGIDANGYPMEIVACENNTIWRLGNGTWVQLPGSGKQVAVDSVGTIYMLDLNGHVNHWSSSAAWEALNGSATYLADGGPTQVWSLNGSEVKRFVETGIQWSRTFSGTVTCNVPPPGQQICTTFTHTVNVQIGTKKKLGAVASAVPWTNSGTWGVTATVNTNDVLDCYIYADPSDCQLYENEGQMQCSAGASENDGASNPNIGTAIDDFDFQTLKGFNGPRQAGTNFAGVWDGTVISSVREVCPALTVSTCPIGPTWKRDYQCFYNDPSGRAGVECYAEVRRKMITTGIDTPYSVTTPYLIDPQGGKHCVISGPAIPYNGQFELLPPCQ